MCTATPRLSPRLSVVISAVVGSEGRTRGWSGSGWNFTVLTGLSLRGRTFACGIWHSGSQPTRGLTFQSSQLSRFPVSFQPTQIWPLEPRIVAHRQTPSHLVVDGGTLLYNVAHAATCTRNGLPARHVSKLLVCNGIVAELGSAHEGSSSTLIHIKHPAVLNLYCRCAVFTEWEGCEGCRWSRCGIGVSSTTWSIRKWRDCFPAKKPQQQFCEASPYIACRCGPAC